MDRSFFFVKALLYEDTGIANTEAEKTVVCFGVDKYNCFEMYKAGHVQKLVWEIIKLL